MGRFLKILLLIIGIILVIIVVGYFAIRAYLTPATLRIIAKRVASDAIQHPVEMGKVDLKFGFKVGITIEDISIRNAKSYSPGSMVQVDKAALNLKLLPLLRRQIVISGIDVSGIKLKLERNRKGELNLTSIIPKETKTTGWSFALSSININNGDVEYTDPVSKMEIRVKDLNQNARLGVNKISTSGKNTIYLLKSKDLPEMVIKIHNSIEYDLLKKNINIKKLTASYEPIDLKVSGVLEKMESLRLDATLTVDDMSKLKSLIPIKSRPNELTGAMTADFSILGTTRKPKIDGRCEIRNATFIPKGMLRGFENLQGSLSFDQTSIRNILIQGKIGKTKLDVSGSITELKDPILNITAKIDGNLQDFESIIEEMKNIQMKGPMTINVNVKGKAKNPSYFGEYSITNAHIDGIGLEKPISDFQIKGTIQNDGARISKCKGHIGNTDFSLNGHISNFKSPVIQLSNTSNTVDLDELLPKTKEVEKTEGKPLLMTLNGDIKIKTLTGMDMVFKNINTNFTYENGIIDLKDCKANTFDGEVRFDFYYNSFSPESYRITTRLYSVNAKEVLKRFLKFENLEGQLTGMSNFQGQGLGEREVVSNLSASGNLKLKNGVFRNFEFFTKLLAWLGMKDYKEVKLTDLVCYFKINKGKAAIDDWALSSKIGNFLTNGTIGLDGSVKLNITSTLSKKYSNIVKKYHGDWIFHIDNKGRAVIDIIVSGKLTSPKFSLDKKKIKKRIQGRIKDEFDKKKKQWENKLKDLFKKK